MKMVHKDTFLGLLDLHNPLTQSPQVHQVRYMVLVRQPLSLFNDHRAREGFETNYPQCSPAHCPHTVVTSLKQPSRYIKLYIYIHVISCFSSLISHDVEPVLTSDERNRVSVW